MNSRRKNLLVYIPVLIGVLYIGGLLGGIGSIELMIWLVLVSAWFYAFVFWAKSPRSGDSSQSPAAKS
jgi:hypothetical protein